MAKRDPRVDAYIEKSPDFAKPILDHIRTLVLATCPDAEETIKWRMPAFAHHGLLCAMAAFKNHCGFVLFKHKLVFEDATTSEKAMGQFGRITTIAELPPAKTMATYIRKAMKLNESGVKMPRPPAQKRALTIPPDFSAALKKNKRAFAAFEKFPPGQKREYVEWITEAKREETRSKRLAQAIEWIAEGKPRNWKYLNC
ncbi:MAG: YdeI/OmpD-associated family protein [Rudaea sp.]